MESTFKVDSIFPAAELFDILSRGKEFQRNLAGAVLPQECP